MTKNDIIILESILKSRKMPVLSEQENYEIFAYEQILKNYELSYEEMLDGKIGKNGVGFFVFINDLLLDEDTYLDDIKNASMELFVIDAKNTFSEIYSDNNIKIIKDIFDFHGNVDVRGFKTAFLKLVPKEINLHVIGVSKNYDEADVSRRVEIVRKIIMESLPRVVFNYRLVNPSELIRLSYKEKSYTLELHFEKQFSKGNSYMVLATLSDYLKFITDEDGKLRKYIFDANIRDYQRQSGVNKEIARTVNSKKNIDFWLINNGITILAKKVSIESGDMIKIDDVQIINGLQTTNVIYENLKDKKEIDNRSLEIKIVVSNDNELRDKIIKGSNYQNPMPQTSLRASDNIQRNVESYFLNNGWYYDRRKNYYKNIGKPYDKIIGIGHLAQAISAVVLREPNRSRKNPTSLTKEDRDYYRIFGSQNYPIYLFCIKLMRKIDYYLHSCRYDENIRTNLRWHLATVVSIRLLKNKAYTEKNIESILNISPTFEAIDECMIELVNLTKTYLELHDITIDAMAKNREFVFYMIEKIRLDNINLQTVDIGDVKSIDDEQIDEVIKND